MTVHLVVNTKTGVVKAMTPDGVMHDIAHVIESNVSLDQPLHETTGFKDTFRSYVPAGLALTTVTLKVTDVIAVRGDDSVPKPAPEPATTSQPRRMTPTKKPGEE